MNKNQRTTFIFFTFILSISIYSLFDSDETIIQLKYHFQNCEYDQAIRLAERILRNSNIEKNDKAQLYVIKGISEYSSNQFLNARITFLEYILSDKDASIDSINISPNIVTFFNELKKDIDLNKI